MKDWSRSTLSASVFSIQCARRRRCCRRQHRQRWREFLAHSQVRVCLCILHCIHATYDACVCLAQLRWVIDLLRFRLTLAVVRFLFCAVCLSRLSVGSTRALVSTFCVLLRVWCFAHTAETFFFRFGTKNYKNELKSVRMDEIDAREAESSKLPTFFYFSSFCL